MDGGRGGAIAVAITLAVFFLRRDLSADVRAAITQTGPAVDHALDGLGKDKKSSDDAARTVEALRARIEALEAASQIQATSDGKMNRAVAIASAIGTLTWGFGDWIVTLLR